MKSLQGMSIIVTGGGSGIGEATARLFAAGGAKVTICGRRADKVKAVAESIGANCAWVVADVTKAEDRAALVKRAVEHGGKLDALVSNAGNMERTPVEEWTEERLLKVFNDNVVAGMMLTQEALPHLVKSQGAIVFIGSIYTVRAYPGAAPYAATKGALEALVKVLATELGPRKIRVNAVRPGAVLTEINQRAGLFDDETAAKRLDGMSNHHALGRIGTPTEIAEGIEYAVRAEWVTGTVIAVDGGLGLGVIV
jgi:NAD(P)-dependent dehydrogenase (short-subunit alcohol dehydrogenase family)